MDAYREISFSSKFCLATPLKSLLFQGWVQMGSAEGVQAKTTGKTWAPLRYIMLGILALLSWRLQTRDWKEFSCASLKPNGAHHAVGVNQSVSCCCFPFPKSTVKYFPEHPVTLHINMSKTLWILTCMPKPQWYSMPGARKLGNW